MGLSSKKKCCYVWKEIRIVFLYTSLIDKYLKLCCLIIILSTQKAPNSYFVVLFSEHRIAPDVFIPTTEIPNLIHCFFFLLRCWQMWKTVKHKTVKMKKIKLQRKERFRCTKTNLNQWPFICIDKVCFFLSTIQLFPPIAYIFTLKQNNPNTDIIKLWVFIYECILILWIQTLPSLLVRCMVC